MPGSLSKDAITIILVTAILMWIMPLMISTYTLTILIVYGMLGLSLGLIWGFGGILCFGQAAFFGLGAYTYAVAAINIGESTVPMVLAVLVPAVFALLLGAMMFLRRRRGTRSTRAHRLVCFCCGRRGRDGRTSTRRLF